MIRRWLWKKMSKWSEYPDLALLRELYDDHEPSEKEKRELDLLFKRIIDAR